MSVKRKIFTAIIVVIVIVAICLGGWFIWKKIGGDSENSAKVYVCKVSEINTASGFMLTSNRFAGIVESQKTLDVKYDAEKKVNEIFVNEGDTVEVGTKLFNYDIESMELELEQGNIEIERMQNEIESNKKQVEQLEAEKKKASSDAQVTYTTQIQSLQTANAKTEYDIKAKKAELDKIQKSIENCDVTAEMAGTIKKINDPTTESTPNNEDMYYDYDMGNGDDGSTLITIMAAGEYRIKGTINEQNMGSIMQDMPIIVRSRLDSKTVWNGFVSSVETEPEQSSNMDYYYGEEDEGTQSSKYPFYIELDSTDGLMLGQHVVIEPDLGLDVEKNGVWIYADYIVDSDTDKPYVWVANEKNKLEKRDIKIGEKDEENGDCEIKSGLNNSDLIAYPSKDLTAGMSTSSEIEDTASYDDGLAGDDMDLGDDIMYDDEMYIDDTGSDDFIDLEAMGIDFDEEGNMIDADGNIMSEDEINALFGISGEIVEDENTEIDLDALGISFDDEGNMIAEDGHILSDEEIEELFSQSGVADE